MNLISVLIYHGDHISSSYLYFHEHVYSVKHFLQQNQFSIYLINRDIKKFLDRQCINRNKSHYVTKFSVVFLLPYLGVDSIHLRKKFNKLLGKIYPHIDFRLFFHASTRIENLPLVMFAPLLFVSLRVIVARLLIMAEHRFISLLDVNSIFCLFFFCFFFYSIKKLKQNTT